MISFPTAPSPSSPSHLTSFPPPGSPIHAESLLSNPTIQINHHQYEREEGPSVPNPRRPVHLVKRHQSYSPELSYSGTAVRGEERHGTARPRLRSEGRSGSYTGGGGGGGRGKKMSMSTSTFGLKLSTIDTSVMNGTSKSTTGSPSAVESGTGTPQELYAFPSFSSQANIGSSSSRSGLLYDSIEGRLLAGSSTPPTNVSGYQQQNALAGGTDRSMTTMAGGSARERAERERAEKIQRYRAGEVGVGRYAASGTSGTMAGSSVYDDRVDDFGSASLHGSTKTQASGSGFSTRSFVSSSTTTGTVTPSLDAHARHPHPNPPRMMVSLSDPSGDELDYPVSPLLSRHRTRRSVDASMSLVSEANRQRDREIEKGVRISTGLATASGGKKKVGKGSGVTGGGLRVKGDVRRGSEEETLEVKVVLLGSQGVGKTTLARRYAEGTFAPESTKPTISASLFTRKLNWEGGEVRLQIWDTVGEERHRSLTKLYYRGAHVAIILYDITSESSFEDVQTWLSELNSMLDEVLIFIVGAKWDLTREGKRKVERKRARVTVARWLGLDVGDGGLDFDIERMNSPGPGSPITQQHPRSRQTSLFRSNTVGSPLSLTSDKIEPPAAVANTRPSPYRFLSLLSSQPPSSNVSDDGRKDIPDNKNLPPGSRGVTGARSNSASAAALMAFSTSPNTPRSPLPTSGSTSGLNLMAATSVAPRRKSEDWGNSRARGEALRAIQGDLTAYASGDNNWKRRSGEILAGWDKASEAEKTQVATAKKAEDLFEEDPYWGKKIMGTNVRIGEVSSKLNKGVDELFASMTAQLALRRRQITMETLRKQRESIYLDPTANSKGKPNSGREGGSGGCC